MKTYQWAVASLALAATVGCGSSDDESSGGGGGGGGGAGAGGGGGAASGGESSGGAATGGGGGSTSEGNVLTWLINDAGSASDAGPAVGAEGVEVCVLDHDEIPCVTSGADGTFALGGLPSDTQLSLTLTKDGFLPGLKTIETTNTDIDGGTPIIMTRLADFEDTDFGTPVDIESNGGINFFAIGSSGNTQGFGPFLGTSVSISPAAGDGPIYGDADGTPTPSLTATENYGGNFLNLPPGEYTLDFTSDQAADCAALSAPWSGWGWPTGDGAKVRTKVVAGRWTVAVGVLCTPTGAPVSKDAGTD